MKTINFLLIHRVTEAIDICAKAKAENGKRGKAIVKDCTCMQSVISSVGHTVSTYISSAHTN